MYKLFDEKIQASPPRPVCCTEISRFQHIGFLLRTEKTEMDLCNFYKIMPGTLVHCIPFKRKYSPVILAGKMKLFFAVEKTPEVEGQVYHVGFIPRLCKMGLFSCCSPEFTADCLLNNAVPQVEIQPQAFFPPLLYVYQGNLHIMQVFSSEL